MNLLLLICCEAWESVNAYRLRSLLTMLGIIIGVCAVVLTLAIGNGMSDKIQHSIQRLGSNVFYITPDATANAYVKSSVGSIPGFSRADAEALKDIPALSAVAPLMTSISQVIAGPQNWNTSVTGSTPDILIAQGMTIIEGDMFTDTDVRSAAHVAVLGQTVANNLFPDGRAVGSIIRMHGLPLRVVGILKGRGQSMEGHDQDDIVVVPLTTAQRQIFGTYFVDSIFQIVVSVKSDRLMDVAQQAITDVLRDRKHVKEGAKLPFKVQNRAAIAEAAAQTGKTLSLFLSATAAITLIVGGIGIMNIMLVSVTERTREIGVRKAIGASATIIMAQFLAESVALSLAGCVLGITLGYSLNHFIAKGTNLNTHISLLSVLIAVSAAAATGIVFGLFPALKAAHLQPAEALRV